MKIVSLNIERNLHLDTVSSFLLTQNPDVVCLFEVFERDLVHFENLLGMKSVFAHQVRFPDTLKPEDPWQLQGVAVFYKDKVISSDVYYYGGDKYLIPDFKYGNDPFKEPPCLCSPLINIELEIKQKTYRIAATHMPVTRDAKVTEYQKYYAGRMIDYLKDFKEFVLCGDFNAPRGGEVFDSFARIYKDNIPPEYKTSLDQNLHRVKGLIFMVDGFFTTQAYNASNVKLFDGVSDHFAVVGEIEII